MNQTVRFDLHPADLHPETEVVPVAELRPGDLVWLSYCSTPTFGLVSRVEWGENGLSVLDLDGNGTTYAPEQARTWTEERLMQPIRLVPKGGQ